MTDEQIAALEALATAATPGPRFNNPTHAEYYVWLEGDYGVPLGTIVLPRPYRSPGARGCGVQARAGRYARASGDE